MSYSKAELTVALRGFAHLFMSRDIERLVRLSATPFTFASPFGAKIITEPAEIRHGLNAFRDLMQQANVTRAEPEVLVIEQESTCRCAFQNRWTYYLPSGEVFNRTLVRYVFKRQVGAVPTQIEMAEYLNTSFPDAARFLLQEA